MSFPDAFKNLAAQLRTVDDVFVQTEKKEAGARKFTLTMLLGERDPVPQFGRTRVTQGVTLELYSKSQDAGAMAAKILEIEEQIRKDRRRGGHAQTTTEPDLWDYEDEDESRGGLTMTSSIGVVTYEN